MTFRGSLSALTISKSGLSLTPGDYFPPKRFKSAESQSTLGWPTSLTFTPRPELEEPRALCLGQPKSRELQITRLLMGNLSNVIITGGQPLRLSQPTQWQRGQNIVSSVICVMIDTSLFPVRHKNTVDKQRESEPWSSERRWARPGEAASTGLSSVIIKVTRVIIMGHRNLHFIC